MDEHGDTLESATVLIVGSDNVRGLIGLDPDDVDFFVFSLEADKTYTICFALESGSAPLFSLIDRDGVTVLQSRFHFSTLPSQFTFTPDVSREYFLEVSRSISLSPTSYLVSVNDDPFAVLSTAVQMFSTISAQTGGAFIVRDDVNFGRTTEYEAALFNIMQSTLGPAILFSNPDDIPQASSLTVTLTGRGTNWRSGSTVHFLGTGINVLSVDVLSATSLTAFVEVDPAAPLGFRDVEVTTPLGEFVEVARGRNVVEIISPITVPAILNVEPNTISQGDSLSMTIRGINTSWDASSSLSLGSGISIDAQNVITPSLIEADITIAEEASIGFHTANVTTPGVGTETKLRSIFVNSGIIAIAEIISISPAEGVLGQTLNILIQGRNTNFESGVTLASLGQGVTALSIDVIDSLNATLEIAIDSTATSGFRDVSLTTGGETAVILNGFFVSSATLTLDVGIDIKPGSDPNSINLKSKGVVPVAILSTDTFDATTVDPLSILFGPNGAKEIHKRGHIKDVNKDDLPDLVLHFKIRKTGIACGDTTVSLTGETFDGRIVEGSDLIKTVRCKEKNGRWQRGKKRRRYSKRL